MTGQRASSVVRVVGLVACSLLPSLVFAAGSSPGDALIFTVPGDPISVTVPNSSTSLWLQIAPDDWSEGTHFVIQTTGSVDTLLSVYASRSDADADLSLASDDDGGTGLNAFLHVPTGFVGPYLVRVGVYSQGGTFMVSGSVPAPEAAVRCDWPSGCSVEAAAQGRPGAALVLGTLRRVASEVLEPSARGGQMSELYWRLSAELVPALLLDEPLRQDVFDRMSELVPLAEAAIRVMRNAGDSTTLTAGDVARLTALLDVLSRRLGADNAASLAALWSELDLASHEGEMLSDVLSSAGLMERRERSVTLLIKLRSVPHIDSGAVRSGVASLDPLLETVRATAIHSLYEATADHRARGLNSTIAVELADAGRTADAVKRLAALPDVEWVELNGEIRALGVDPYASAQWGLDAIHARSAWDMTTGNCDAPVAVVDTGLRPDLVDFLDRIQPGKGYDFVERDNDPMDHHGHGTHVAGIIAATAENSTSIAGVAPGVCFFAVKALGDDGRGTWEDVARGIVYAADQGAKVINLSIGSTDSSNAIDEALAYAAQRDVVMVAAAGNDGVNQLEYPASSPWTISVGAVGSDLEHASYSNWGEGLDLVAPGTDVVSLFDNGESCLGSGTSMAAPHVSGVAALLRSFNPALSRDEVTAILLRTATELPEAGPNHYYGSGLVDAYAALSGAPPPVTVIVTATDAVASERPHDNAMFTVSRTGASGTALKVKLLWSGTATKSVDYRRVPRSVTIPAGATAASVTVIPVNDKRREPDETVVLTAGPGRGYGVGSADHATVTIRSDE